MTQSQSPRGRLLFILNDAPFFVSHRLSLAVAARDAGFDVHIAVAYDVGAVAIIEAAGIIHHDIPLKRGARGPFGELRLIGCLARLIRALRPDIVHTVTMKPVIYGGGLARLLKVPAVINAVTGLGYLFLIEGTLARLQRSIIKRFYKFALGHSNGRVIFQNPDDLNLFLGEHLVDRNRSIIIKGTGVDLDKFRVLPEPPDRPVVMFPARVIGDKGVHEFVAAAKALKSRSQQVQFVIVGRTDPDNPTDVGEPTIREWERDGLVEWWGFSDDMADTLPKANVVCMPSYREGLPRVLIEAAACGRPIVTADVPGCREIVKDGENGFLVPVRDGTATADAIERLLIDAGLRQRMASRSRQIAEAEYALQAFVTNTFTVYDSVCPSASGLSLDGDSAA